MASGSSIWILRIFLASCFTGPKLLRRHYRCGEEDASRETWREEDATLSEVVIGTDGFGDWAFYFLSTRPGYESIRLI